MNNLKLAKLINALKSTNNVGASISVSNLLINHKKFSALNLSINPNEVKNIMPDADELSYFKMTSDRGRKTYLAYDPKKLSDKPSERGDSGATGGIVHDIAKYIKQYNVFWDPVDKRIYLNNLYDPQTSFDLEQVISANPEIGVYHAFEFMGPTIESIKDLEKLAQDILNESEEVESEFSFYSPGLKEGERIKFKFKLLKSISNLPFYHATRKSNLDSIMSQGLKTSAQLREELGTNIGWSEFNLNLQNAIYLTKDFSYAKDIAQTIANRFEEPAVVIEVSPGGLKNLESIVVDEDVYQTEHGFLRNENIEDYNFPEFFNSLKSSIESIGYKDPISSDSLIIKETIGPE